MYKNRVVQIATSKLKKLKMVQKRIGMKSFEMLFSHVYIKYQNILTNRVLITGKRRARGAPDSIYMCKRNMAKANLLGGAASKKI